MTHLSYISLATLLSTVYSEAETVQHNGQSIKVKKKKPCKRPKRMKDRSRGKPGYMFSNKDMPHYKRQQR